MRSLSILLLACTLNAHGQTSVLFIGNSYIYSNDLPYMFQQISLSFGETVNTSMRAPGGFTFLDHTADPATQEAIASQQWDYVVLQEQSQLGALPTNETFSNINATALMYDIQESSECAYPVYFMTWGRQNGDAQNCAQFPQVCTYDGMQQALRDNYIQFALETEGYVSPVGWAWKQVRDTHPEIQLYHADGSHPSVSGTYLAACVFYCTIFRQSCAGTSFTSTIPADEAAILQAIASSTVLDSPDTWNLNEPGSTDAEPTSQSSDVDGVITFHHFGQGEHLWTCSNGQISTEAEPTFTFEWDGFYSYTHVYTDPCGHTDTHTGTIQVYTTGVYEAGRTDPSVSSANEGMITVRAASQGDRFEVFDGQGRMVRSTMLGGRSIEIPCPSGLMFWSIHGADGRVMKGKVLVR